MKHKKIYQLCKFSVSYETLSYKGFSLERLEHYYNHFKLTIEDNDVPLCYTRHLFEDREAATHFSKVCSTSKDSLFDLVGQHRVTFDYYWVVPSYLM